MMATPRGGASGSGSVSPFGNFPGPLAHLNMPGTLHSVAWTQRRPAQTTRHRQQNLHEPLAAKATVKHLAKAMLCTSSAEQRK